MIVTATATCANGVSTPTEPDVEAGVAMMVPAEDTLASRPQDSLMVMFDMLHKSFPPDASDYLPTDFAENYKRYGYGHAGEEA